MINSVTPSIEFRIPISANEQYMHMLQFLLVSIELHGGELAKSAHFVISVVETPQRETSIKRTPGY